MGIGRCKELGTVLVDKDLQALLSATVDLGYRVERRSHHAVACGAYGEVWQGVLRSAGGDFRQRSVALKFMKLSLKRAAQRFTHIGREVHVWLQLCHPNILPFIGLCPMYGQGQFCMVSPWQSNGHAIEYLRTQYTEDKRGHLKASKLIVVVIEGLTYLYGRSPPIMHGDLRETNILVDANGCAVLCDFGLSGIAGEAPTTFVWRKRGTLRYMAPERIESDSFRLKSNNARMPASNVDSFGMTIHEILTGVKPFSDYLDETVVLPIRRDEIPPDLAWRTSQEGAESLVPLMKQCWTTEVTERPYAFEIWKMLINSSVGQWGLNPSTAAVDHCVPADDIGTASQKPSDPCMTSVPHIARYNERVERTQWGMSPCIPNPTEASRHHRLERYTVDKGIPVYIGSEDWDLGNRVEMQGANAVAGGNTADIWRGLLFPASGGTERVKLVALKMVRVPRSATESDRTLKRFSREVSIWSCLDHDNILPFLGTTVKHSLGSVCVVSPWQRNGHIMDYLQMHYTEDADGHAAVFRLIQGIISGLAYLHRREVIHGDLRGSNVLVDNGGVALLADFSLSHMIDAEVEAVSGSNVIVGSSYRWMAPEQLDPSKYCHNRIAVCGPASDIYSFGMTMYEILSGDIPFGRQVNELEVISLIDEGKRPPIAGISWRASRDMIETLLPLILRCSASTPKERPLTDTVLSMICDSNAGRSVSRRRVSEMNQGQLSTISSRQLLKDGLEKGKDVLDSPRRCTTSIIRRMGSLLRRTYPNECM